MGGEGLELVARGLVLVRAQPLEIAGARQRLQRVLSVGAQLDLVPWPVAVLPAAWLALVAAALPLILLWAPTEPSPLLKWMTSAAA